MAYLLLCLSAIVIQGRTYDAKLPLNQTFAHTWSEAFKRESLNPLRGFTDGLSLEGGDGEQGRPSTFRRHLPPPCPPPQQPEQEVLPENP